MTNQVISKPDYGNWVSRRLIYIFTMLGLILLPVAIPFWVLTIPSIVCFAIAAYFAYSRYLFSAKGANVQNQVWNCLIDSLEWDGKGKALDIGCGNGVITIRLAKKFSDATVVGIDFWGDRWEYSKTDCEANAQAEGVSNRVTFQKASASKLPFEDDYFDAAVSNLCFHEVSDSKDKVAVINEALRVVKKGGVFAFQDLFLLKPVYGTPEALVGTIKSWGITKVEFIKTRDEPFIPKILKLPFMLGRLSILKGKK
jgi:SAM-dependent methyltransferase